MHCADGASRSGATGSGDWLTHFRMNQLAHPLVVHPAGQALLRPGVTRRVVLRGFAGLGLAGVATAAYGVGVEPESILVTRYRLTPPRWPAGRRLAIHVIADLHAGGPNMT